jgi:hypothetical protein
VESGPARPTWACVDFDYLKKSDRQGARQFQRPRDRPVQGWVLRRGAALIVAVRPDTGNFCVLAQEQFEGICTAQKFVKMAARVHRVLGHNLLNSDYQAIGQVVEVSDELISKTIDIQDSCCGWSLPTGHASGHLTVWARRAAAVKHWPRSQQGSGAYDRIGHAH